MGSLPMNGKASFSSQFVTLACVTSARLFAVLASQSRETTSKVFAAASVLACFSSRLATPGSMPSARSSRAFRVAGELGERYVRVDAQGEGLLLP